MRYRYLGIVKLINIYRCLCDETRLRILNLLGVSPLCVCHIQKVLGKSQVTVSQHLSYLKVREMVAVQRYRNWMIYSLPPCPPPDLDANLRCLQDCIQTEPIFKKDRARLANLLGERSVRSLLDEGYCDPPPAASKNSGSKTNPTNHRV